MNNLLHPLINILELNTRLFINSLDGISNLTAVFRPNDSTNNIIFIASHLLDARYYLANYIGIEEVCPFKEIFDGIESVEEMKDFPQLDVVKQCWTDITEKIIGRLNFLDEEELSLPSEINFPMEDNSKLGAISFLVQHDSYHIGQLSLLRKYFGFGSMNYN